MTNDNEKLVDHLFRYEAGKMVSILTRLFGIHHMEMAQDVVQDTFIKALNEWRMKPLPQNPSAWLMQTAKNRAIDIIRREKYHTDFAKDITPLLKSEYTVGYIMNEIFTEGEINDSQLRMIFTCCHPALSPEMQIALTLRTIAGFSIPEIANALVSSTDAINKGLFRARKRIKEENIAFEIPSGNALHTRLDNVLTVLYLLFNEGYNSSKADELIRKDLCLEAIRLCLLLIESKQVCTPQAYALLSLMCFHAARFDSRKGINDEIILLKHQDRSTWNPELLTRGYYYLSLAAEGSDMSVYHIEAAIIAFHCMAEKYEDTNWKEILHCYDALIALKKSPMVYLNRAIVISKIQGIQSGIDTILQIDKIDSLLSNHYLFNAVLGDLYFALNEYETAHSCFSAALALTTSKAEKILLTSKIEKCQTLAS